MAVTSTFSSGTSRKADRTRAEVSTVASIVLQMGTSERRHRPAHSDAESVALSCRNMLG
jgi:hypothetical protein